MARSVGEGKRLAFVMLSCTLEAIPMSRSSPFVIVLSDADRAELRRRARCYSAPHAEVVRAKIVLLAADSLENIAEPL